MIAITFFFYSNLQLAADDYVALVFTLQFVSTKTLTSLAQYEQCTLVNNY